MSDTPLTRADGTQLAKALYAANAAIPTAEAALAAGLDVGEQLARLTQQVARIQAIQASGLLPPS